jgi:hypothetical protein
MIQAANRLSFRHTSEDGMRLATLIFAPFCLLLAACGSGAQLAAPEVRAVTYDGSDWQANEISVEVTSAAGGWRVDVASQAEAAADTLLLELRFDDALAAQDAQVHCVRSELSLLAAGKPGGIGLGIIMPAGESILPGRLLTFTMSAAPKSASLPPHPSTGTQVSDLKGTAVEGGVRLDWSYRLKGDYDQNSEVNIADLSALGPRLGHDTSDGFDDEADEVVDGDGNGVVTLSDLTPIGAYFLNSVQGYSVFSATGDDLGSAVETWDGDITFAASSIPTARRTFYYTVSDPERVSDAH